MRLLVATTNPNKVREIRALLFGYLTRGRTFAQPPPGTAERPQAGFYGFAAPRSEVFGFIDRVTGGWHVTETDGVTDMMSV